jgi:hypothetical protein
MTETESNPTLCTAMMNRILHQVRLRVWRFFTGIGVSVTGSVRSIPRVSTVHTQRLIHTQDEQRQDKNPIGLKLMPMTEAESNPICICR